MQEAHKDGVIPPDQDWIENDYYIRNNNPMLRTFPIATNARVLLQGPMDSSLQERDQLDVLHGMAVWITLQNGVVSEIRQQYRP